MQGPQLIQATEKNGREFVNGEKEKGEGEWVGKSAASSQNVVGSQAPAFRHVFGPAPLQSFKEAAANPTNRTAKLTRIRIVPDKDPV